MNCIIADDEPLSQEGLESFVNEVPFLKLQGVCASAMEVMTALNGKQVDLMFLDIQLPKMSGITLLRTIPEPPLTIITTAYQNYAIEGYELNVTDYLLKPFSFERFLLAVNKAKRQFDLLNQAREKPAYNAEYFFVKCERSYEKIFFSDICYIEALQNYILIIAEARKYTVYLTMKDAEEQLPPAMFLKINRSYIVNLNKVNSMDGNEVVVGKTSLQIGRSFKDDVMKMLLNPHLIKRGGI